MYEELVKKLRYESTWRDDYPEDKNMLLQAADAIEELAKDLERANTFSDCWKELAEDAKERFQKAIDKLKELDVENTNLTGHLAEVYARQQWIPVTERLPEEAGRYIVFLKASEDECERWEEYGWEGDPSLVLEALYNSQQKIWQTESFSYNAILSAVDMENDDAVTHWMPLPEPPKEET